MIALLNFFEETANNNMGWITWVILGVLVVGMVLMMIIPQKKRKKQEEEMMAKLTVGSVITTIGGIVGEVVELDDKHVCIVTGVGENKSTMKFVRQAIHSVGPVAGSAEAIAAEKTEKSTEEEVDEIK